MSIEALKEAARSFEQKEEWGKALDQYKKAIEQLAKEEIPDIGLYNRVADLQVRQGHIQDAVLNYEQAITLYLEADLPNNAIGVCKKIVRNMPARTSRPGTSHRRWSSTTACSPSTSISPTSPSAFGRSARP